MKVLFKKNFDYDLGGNMTAFCQASDEPLTVKKEIGEAAIAGGYAVAVDDDSDSDSEKAGTLGGIDSGTDGKSLSDIAGIDGMDRNNDGATGAKAKRGKA